MALGVILTACSLTIAASALEATTADPQEAGDAAVAEPHTTDEPHHESLAAFLGRITNFAILAGLLVWLLRKPIAAYLTSRGDQIRGELEGAAAMKETAQRQIDDIGARLQQLPSELEALRARGAQEIAAEESRIRAEAEAERERLLEQARREIDLHVRLARRELVEHAADLAVGVARERIRHQITDADQRRLVDRYLAAVQET